MLNLLRNAENLDRNSPETLQVLPKATHEAHNPTNDSKAIPKAATFQEKSPKCVPKATKRLQQDSNKLQKNIPKGIPNRVQNLRLSVPRKVAKTLRLSCF